MAWRTDDRPNPPGRAPRRHAAPADPAHGWRGLIPFRRAALSENRDLIAGAVGAALAPVASVGFGVPFWVSVPCAVVVYLGLRTLLRPPRLFHGLDPEKYEGVRLGVARTVLGDATKALRELRRHARSIRDGGMRKQFEHLHYVAHTVVQEVEEDPRRLPHVQRLLTYYLPAAVRLAHGYRAVERRLAPGPDRKRKVEDTVARMDRVFADFSDRLVTPDLEDLDLELKLLDDELAQEMGRRR